MCLRITLGHTLHDITYTCSNTQPVIKCVMKCVAYAPDHLT